MCKTIDTIWRDKRGCGEGDDDDDEFRFNDASTHEGHLRQNGELTWFCSETIIMISHVGREIMDYL